MCIFYLVLRALDTVEDDMTISLEEKLPMLKEFYTYLQLPDWKFMKSQEKDKMVLEQFPVVSMPCGKCMQSQEKGKKSLISNVMENNITNMYTCKGLTAMKDGSWPENFSLNHIYPRPVSYNFDTSMINL